MDKINIDEMKNNLITELDNLHKSKSYVRDIYNIMDLLFYDLNCKNDKNICNKIEKILVDIYDDGIKDNNIYLFSSAFRHLKKYKLLKNIEENK